MLSIDIPVKVSPSSGIAFHSLHATSQALQPMQTEVSVKNPTRGGRQPGVDLRWSRSASVMPARGRYSATSRRGPGPRGRRPGRMSPASALSP